jgi:hypothetical protein
MTRQVELSERHRRVVTALQAGGPEVPQSLLRQAFAVEARPRPRLSARPALAGAVALAMAIAAIAVLSLNGPNGVSTMDAALLSPLPAEHATPARSFAGVSYPDWSSAFGWRKQGQRTDELGGRRTTTAFYRHTHHRIGYTVISGRPIDPPDGADVVTVNGVELHRFRLGEQDVVTFVRNGHTCVLSGKVHRASTLVKLASSEENS